MRYPGDDGTGQAPGRRQGRSEPDTPARRGRRGGAGQSGGESPGGGSSVFSPGYQGGRRAAARPARPDTGLSSASGLGGRYGQASGSVGKGPVHGFPPAPGQPPPLYPPGQFSAWNRVPGFAADADGAAAGVGYADGYGAGSPADGYAGPGQPGRGYGAGGRPSLAVSDPAADVTSTDSWGAVADGPQASGWTGSRPPGTGGTTAPGRTSPGRPGPRPAGADWPGRDDAGRRSGYPARLAPGATPPGADTGQGGAAGQYAAGQHGAAEKYRTAGAGRLDRAAPRQHQADSDYGDVAGNRRADRAGGRTRTRRRGRRSRWLVAISLLVCLALAAGVYGWFKFRHGGTTAQPPAHSATSPPARPSPSPSPKPPPGRWRYIGTRASDPAALTTAQLFPLRFAAGGSYTRTVQRSGKKCAAAVVGSRLQAAVGHASCTQVLRASYLSARKKQMGTIGVLNLKSFSAAEKAGKSAGAAQFIQPLNGRKGPTSNLSKATGLEEAEVKGHYLILVLADFTNLRAPSSRAQRRALETFMSDLIRRTVNVSLTTRMVTGKP